MGTNFKKNRTLIGCCAECYFGKQQLSLESASRRNEASTLLEVHRLTDRRWQFPSVHRTANSGSDSSSSSGELVYTFTIHECAVLENKLHQVQRVAEGLRKLTCREILKYFLNLIGFGDLVINSRTRASLCWRHTVKLSGVEGMKPHREYLVIFYLSFSAQNCDDFGISLNLRLPFLATGSQQTTGLLALFLFS